MKQKITLIPAGGNNFASVVNTVQKLGHSVVIAKETQQILEAQKLILPGVGSMQKAQLSTLKNIIQQLTQPLLGICLGMQMLFNYSEENPSKKLLGVFNENVIKFNNNLIVPHTGWNKILFNKEGSIFEGIKEDYTYFTHSYYAPKFTHTLAYSTYQTQKITAIAHKHNFYGFQFHPERSGTYGETLLQRFLEEA